MKMSAELCYRLAQEISDQKEIAIARLNLGKYRERCEDYDGALSSFEQSFADFKELNDPYWTAVANSWLRPILAVKDNHDLTELVMQDVELARKVGEREHLGETLQEFSFWHFRNNRLDEAEKYAREADRLLKEIGSTMNLASSFYADMAWVNGKFQEAALIYNEIQERLGILGEKNIRSSVIGLLGLVTMESGNLDQAQAYLEQALAISREVENTWFTASRLADLSYVFYLKGNIEKFKQFFMECIALIKERHKIHIVHPLLFLLQSIYSQNIEISVKALGVIRVVEEEMNRPLDPVHKRYWNKIETHAREVLGDREFKTVFMEGQTVSRDDLLDLILKALDGITR
jgi:tetratricopeptide (TPR) repeat protein